MSPKQSDALVDLLFLPWPETDKTTLYDAYQRVWGHHDAGAVERAIDKFHKEAERKPSAPGAVLKHLAVGGAKPNQAAPDFIRSRLEQMRERGLVPVRHQLGKGFSVSFYPIADCMPTGGYWRWNGCEVKEYQLTDRRFSC
jgi:hypothetical protein